MSTYTKITKHPQTGDYEVATWHDDYFGPDIYGVGFKSDNKIYPVDLVAKKQVLSLHLDDVTNAYLDEFDQDNESDRNAMLLDFYKRIDERYKARTGKEPV